jgi:hypothetical protein
MGCIPSCNVGGSAPSARSDAAAERHVQRERGRGEGPRERPLRGTRQKPPLCRRSVRVGHRLEGPSRRALERGRPDGRGGASRDRPQGPPRARGTVRRGRFEGPFRGGVSRGTSQRNRLKGLCRGALKRDDRRLEEPWRRDRVQGPSRRTGSRSRKSGRLDEQECPFSMDRPEGCPATECPGCPGVECGFSKGRGLCRGVGPGDFGYVSRSELLEAFVPWIIPTIQQRLPFHRRKYRRRRHARVRVRPDLARRGTPRDQVTATGAGTGSP